MWTLFGNIASRRQLVVQHALKTRLFSSLFSRDSLPASSSRHQTPSPSSEMHHNVLALTFQEGTSSAAAAAQTAPGARWPPCLLRRQKQQPSVRLSSRRGPGGGPKCQITNPKGKSRRQWWRARADKGRRRTRGCGEEKWEGAEGDIRHGGEVHFVQSVLRGDCSWLRGSSCSESALGHARR